MNEQSWIEEKHGEGLTYRYQIKERLFSSRSSYQKIELVEAVGHGRMLFNDGAVMVSERDEFAYHEMIAHVPLMVHPRPEKILVIGGGDGGTAREVVRHDSVKECTVVEIDEMVVQTCKKYLPACARGLEHPKVRLIIADGVDFVLKNQDKFDVVLIDSTDPVGPATPLFGLDFYRGVHDRLKDDGIIVSQGESPWYEVKMQNKLLEIKRELFEIVTCYNYNNLTYPGGIWSFTWGSKRYHPLNDYQGKKRLENISCRYYNNETHRAAFTLPQFQLENVKHLRKRF